jgi:hypothetical protein
MNVAAGFDTGFSFFYAAISQTGSVTVYDGLNGTGNVLATVSLGLTSSNCPSQYQAGFCPFDAAGVAFSGTAHSVSFAGVANQVVFDDVTFGASNPGHPIPEPASFGLVGLALVGLAAARRRKAV